MSTPRTPVGLEPSSARSVPPGLVYGLDIETDTTVDGLDASVAPVVAVALCTEKHEHVFDGDEAHILRGVDQLLQALDPGILVTWYGSGFDLPFLQVRSTMAGIELGLRLEARDDLGGVRASWHQHHHLDAYRVYRNDLGRLLDVSCSLKSVARLLGYRPVEVDIEHLHQLDRSELSSYVASDARLGRAAALRRWTTAAPFIDQLEGWEVE
jgi:uncharacterized protein YprB with RNaseH-like and TPR domain